MITSRGGIPLIEDGKITEPRLYFDQLEMLTQLGLMPAPATF